MSIEEEIYQIADELRGLSNVGLYYTQDPYDRERYNKVLTLSARLAGLASEHSAEELLACFEDTLMHLSPLVGASSIVQKDGKILLIQRTDNQLWAMPGGLVEVGEVLAEAALRELKEEAGIDGRAVELLGIFDSRLWKTQVAAHLYHFVFRVESDDLQPNPGLEALEARFFPVDDLPPLAPGHRRRFPVILKLLSGEITPPYFDGRADLDGLSLV